MTSTISKKGVFRVLNLTNFLFAFSIALPAYITSNFLNQFISEEFVGVLYAVGSILTILALVNMPKILRRFTNYKTALTLVLTQIVLLLILATTNVASIIIPSFIVYWVTITLSVFSLDVFLENFSSDSSTGTVRGKFFTASSVAWILAQIATGQILNNGEYWKVYLISAILTLTILWLLARNLKNFVDPVYDKEKLTETFKLLRRRKNVLKIFAANLLLYFFYSWMVIYIPIYLHDMFTMKELGIIFTVMLLPFPLLQFPAGKIADAKLGEKELLVTGFIITAFTTALLSFIETQNIWVWATALFMTRIGASLVEVMTDTYFFKKIDGTDIHVLSIYRANRSVAYTIAPLIASAFLLFFDFRYLFVALSIILLSGVAISLTLKDTK